MTVDSEIREALDESFRAALVLTGSVEVAERAVTDALVAVGANFSARSLLIETARLALQPGPLAGESSSMLPVELQALARLLPVRRYSFVLRLLVGLDLEACCQILRLSRDEVEEALWKSLLDLPGWSNQVSADQLTPRLDQELLVELERAGCLTDRCKGKPMIATSRRIHGCTPSGCVISSGRTQASNSSVVTKPSLRAASRKLRSSW